MLAESPLTFHMHIAKALADLHGVYVVVCILFEEKVHIPGLCLYRHVCAAYLLS